MIYYCILYKPLAINEQASIRNFLMSTRLLYADIIIFNLRYSKNKTVIDNISIFYARRFAAAMINILYFNRSNYKLLLFYDCTKTHHI